MAYRRRRTSSGRSSGYSSRGRSYGRRRTTKRSGVRRRASGGSRTIRLVIQTQPTAGPATDMIGVKPAPAPKKARF